MRNAYAVILAGGKGERFWPLSTSRKPKQMLSLTGGKPLVTMAVDRLKGLIPPSRIFVITSAGLVKAVRKAVPSLPAGNVVGEPFGRDTAAAVALGSALVHKRDPKGVFAVLTADHVIGNIALFQRTLRRCCEVAEKLDALITIGITPANPSTGFGYIETAGVEKTCGGVEFLRGRRFVEKPDRKTAEAYIVSGSYLWNSGMFIWSVETIRNAMALHAPALFKMARRMESAIGTRDFGKRLAAEYARLEKISVDYAVMEKSKNILVACGRFAWDDVGSWAALANHFKTNKYGNITVGMCESVESSGNIVMSDLRLTGLVGVKDLIVVQADGATLVCSRDKAQDVKKLIALLRKKRRYEDLL